MDEISHSQNRLSIGEVTVELRHPIKEVLMHNEMVIALLDVPSGTIDNRNVLAFDQTGSPLWAIEASDDEGRDNPYMSVESQNGELIAEAWNGIRYVADEDTGEIRDGEIQRF